MQPDTAGILIVVGRLLLGGLFVAGGLRHFFILDPLAAVMAARGVPSPRLVLIAGSIWEIVFGALLIAGLFVPYAASALIVFTLAATVMLLNFWDMQGMERDTTRNAALTNLALVGGLLIAAAQAL